MMDNLRNILESEDIYLDDKIYTNIEQGIDRNARHIHVSFLINIKNNTLLSYGFNIYFKTRSFPYSIHSEVNTITRYYKNQTLSKSKKKLIVIKISKNGKIGLSKPCQTCINYISNNMRNINLTSIKYSTIYNNLENIRCNEIFEHTYKISSAFKIKNKNKQIR
jgi:hypothetical protein